MTTDGNLGSAITLAPSPVVGIAHPAGDRLPVARLHFTPLLVLELGLPDRDVRLRVAVAANPVVVGCAVAIGLVGSVAGLDAARSRHGCHVATKACHTRLVCSIDGATRTSPQRPEGTHDCIGRCRRNRSRRAGRPARLGDGDVPLVRGDGNGCEVRGCIRAGCPGLSWWSTASGNDSLSTSVVVGYPSAFSETPDHDIVLLTSHILGWTLVVEAG